MQTFSSNRLRGLVVLLEEHHAPSLWGQLQKHAPPADWWPPAAPEVVLRLPAPFRDLCLHRVWRTFVLPHVSAVGQARNAAMRIHWVRLGLPKPAPAAPDAVEEAAAQCPPEQRFLDAAAAGEAAELLRHYGASLDLASDFNPEIHLSVIRCVLILQRVCGDMEPSSAWRLTQDLRTTPKLLKEGEGRCHVRRIYQAFFLVQTVNSKDLQRQRWRQQQQWIQFSGHIPVTAGFNTKTGKYGFQQFFATLSMTITHF